MRIVVRDVQWGVWLCDVEVKMQSRCFSSLSSSTIRKWPLIPSLLAKRKDLTGCRRF